MQSKINPKLKVVEAVWPKGKFNGIALVGEAPGENEAIAGSPFIGSSGRLLDSLLLSAGISRAECFVTNVFSERPPENDVTYFFDKPGVVKDEWKYELTRLKSELESIRPSVIVALGATAMWALTGLIGISKFRGTAMLSTLVPGVKVLPTYHPAYVMRQWQARPTVGRDLLKARIESQTSTLTRPVREVWIRPSLADLAEFERLYMPKGATTGEHPLSTDLETDPWVMKQVLCIGFAPSPDVAICVPFVDKTKKGWSYWPTLEEEVAALNWCLKFIENPAITKLGQNFMYDMQWLDRKLRAKARGPVEDTMIMHHALEPELEKGLAFLSSVYTNEQSWKTMIDWKTIKAGA